MSTPASSSPPPLPDAEPASGRPNLTAILSLVLLLFLISAVVSFADNSLYLTLGRQELAPFSGVAFLIMLLAGFLTYLMIALVPGIPKRVFLPVSLFIPVVYIAIIPLLVVFSGYALPIIWGVSLIQILLGLFILHRLHGRVQLSWPLFPEGQIADRPFSWGNLAGLLTAGVFLLLPALALYAAFTAKITVEHFSDGFVALRPNGISMQVRKYIREDGKKITLVPMSHVGEPEFYHDLAASFPPNSVILMEGVTDKDQLMTTHSDYSKMATSVGGVEQMKVFKPQGEIVAADVDMNTLSPATLGLLKTAMLVHSKGVTAETLPILMKPMPPGMEKQLMDDILTKRNHHLLEVMRERLPTSDNIIIPWGAAHMPEIAREIQKEGFRMVETTEFVAIRFGS